jgi:uncharacterized damage-inducible protein DinB
MPESMSIDGAEECFRMSADFINRIVADLSDEEWFKRPTEHTNHMTWIVGHIIWARGAMVSQLGGQYDEPWLRKFARGVKLQDQSEYPSPSQLKQGLRDVSTALTAAFENVAPETLEKPVERIPSADGKVSGVANFLALHDTYHVGQASYLRCWLGKTPLMG